MLTGLVQVTIAGAALVLLVAGLRRRRFRVIATVAGGFVAAAALTAVIMYLTGQGALGTLTAGLRRHSWLAGAGFPDPAVIAGLAAVAVAAAPWLSRPWRRTAWATLLLIAAARVITGGLSPIDLVLAVAAGVAVGAGLLVVFGVPDRRMDAAGVAAALRAGGVPASEVTVASVTAKGSRPFRAVTEDGQALFVKVFGSDQRDADLLYRTYRAIRLRGVGDTRPAASLFKAVEHEALVAVMAERAEVAVPHVGQLIKAGDGSVLLTMELIAGQPLDEIPDENITDKLARDLWLEVSRLHQARIAHRSLHAGNIMVGEDGCPRLVNFSFAELAATGRQMAIDTAELVTSLAGRIGPDRAVGSALPAIGRDGVAAAVPLLQPLALSASTRRRIKGQDALLKRTREAAIAASGDQADTNLAQLQRVRPRTLLTIAALAGAFYYLLPQIAQVSSSWHAILSANWAWLPVVIAAVGADLRGERDGAHRRRARPRAVLADGGGPVRIVVHQPGVAGQRGRDGAERTVPAEGRIRRPGQRRGGRREQPRGRHHAPGAHRGVLRTGRPRPDEGVQAALRQQDPADPGGDHCRDRHRPGHPARPPLGQEAAGARAALRGHQPQACRLKPGQAWACCSAARR